MKKLLKGLGGYKRQILLIFVLTLIQVLTELSLPSIMADIVDIGVVEGDVPYIWRMGAFMLMYALFGMLAAIWKSYVASRVGTMFSKNLRQDIFTKVESFSMYEFQKIGASSLITRTTNDVTQIQTVVVMILNIFLRAPFMAIGSLIMAVQRDVPLTGLLLIVVVIMGVLIGLIASQAVPKFKKLQTRIDKMNLVLRERLTGIRVIRAFNRVHEEQARYESTNTELKDIAVSINRLMAILNPLMIFLFNVTAVAIIYYGAIRVDNGALQVGDLMAFIQYGMQIMFSLVMLTMLFILIPRGQVSAVRINEVLEMEYLTNHPKQTTPEMNDNKLTFKKVSFKYPHAEEPVLYDIDFEANTGETVAIIGGTGSGKSTLINLIPKFFLPTEGNVIVNGIDTRNYTEEDLRNQIGFIPQKAMLFSGSIRDNVAFGTNATDEEIYNALEIAQVKDYVDSLEEGLDYEITQSGTNVSGGQKQRLSIARAIVKHKFLYIFDDSFSALDYQTDANLRESLKEVTTDSITLIVAQRVATIRNADRILVLDQGKLVGSGTHDELMMDNEVYQSIVYSQLTAEEA